MLVTLLVLGCVQPEPPLDPGPTVLAPSPNLRRLTQQQYRNTLSDLYGLDVVLPSSLEPDTVVDGLASLGASVAATSPLGVERYEEGSRLVAAQRASAPGVFGCSSEDLTCVDSFIDAEGSLLFRRPLSAEERSQYRQVFLEVSSVSDAEQAASVVLWAMLQSPNFLYRTEHTEGSLEPFELAGRLSYFLWNGPPDAELLRAATDGDLSDPDLKAQQVDRMLADDRYRRSVRDFFTELLELDHVQDLVKDPVVFPHATPTLLESSVEETLSVIEHHVVDEQADYRSLFTSRRTYVDPSLAALYDVPAPEAEGFGWVELPEGHRRAGLLGHASLLNLHAHATESSATLRGLFVRTKLLCQGIPPAPADVDTDIPEASDAPTLRDRLEVHRTDPSCSACHNLLDPIGLALENFDGQGRYRTTENAVTIDVSGQLDGDVYDGPVGLGQAIANHEELSVCITGRLYAYGVGHTMTDGEEEALTWLRDGFVQDGYQVRGLMRNIALSEAFATGGAL